MLRTTPSKRPIVDKVKGTRPFSSKRPIFHKSVSNEYVVLLPFTSSMQKVVALCKRSSHPSIFVNRFPLQQTRKMQIIAPTTEGHDTPSISTYLVEDFLIKSKKRVKRCCRMVLQSTSKNYIFPKTKTKLKAKL